MVFVDDIAMRPAIFYGTECWAIKDQMSEKWVQLQWEC